MKGGRLRPILLAACLAALVMGTAWLTGADPIAAAQLAARWTARLSFLLFLPVFVASSLVRLAPTAATRALLRDRRYWGLGFALAHFVHLGALITYLGMSGVPPKLLTLTGGGGGYVILLAMVLTSNDGAQRAMGRWWKRLHRIGMYWLWFVFAFSYASRIADPARMSIGLVFAPMAFTALGLRLAAAIRVRRRRVASA